MKIIPSRWSWIAVVVLAGPAVVVSASREEKMKQRIRRLQKAAKSTDYAVGLIDAGKLQHGLDNSGNLASIWGWNSELYLALPGAWYKGYGYIPDLSMMIGVPEGPWTPRYLDTASNDTLSFGPSVTEENVGGDWGPAAGHLGKYHSGNITIDEISARGSPPPFPVMATSTDPETWPESGWPGEWAVDAGPDGIARTQDDSVLTGQFTGDKELFFAMNDFDLNDRGLKYAEADDQTTQGHSLGIEMLIQAIGYGRSFAEDFIFFPMKIVYTGEDTLRGVYLGFYIDVDAPEYSEGGTINHREDWMAFLREEYDADLDTTYRYNMGYIYDQESAPYSGSGPIAYTSIKLLETPLATEEIDLDGDGEIDIEEGEQLGITDWHWFRWENRPGVIKSDWQEWEQYKLLSGGSRASLWDHKKNGWGDFKVSQGDLFMKDTLSDGRIFELTSQHIAEDAWFHPDEDGKLNPHFDDYTIMQRENWNDLDCVFIMSSGPFTLSPGDSTTFSFGLIMGDDLEDLKLNARAAQIMYNLNYLGANPPRAPEVTAVPGDEKVTLYWDDASETSEDILTRYPDFEGYKIYRTTVHPANNQWGTIITDGQGNEVGFEPLAQFDVVDGISGLDPVYPYLNRGNESGLVHSWTDTDVHNGVTYWYSVTAYDRGISAENDSSFNPDDWADLNYLENAKGNNPDAVPNLVEVVPGRKPLGYEPPELSRLHPDPDSLGKGSIDVLLLNPDEAEETHTYTLAFDDTTLTDTLLYSVWDEDGNVLVNKSGRTGGDDGGKVFNGVRLIIDEYETVEYLESTWMRVVGDTSNMTFGPLAAADSKQPWDYVIEFKGNPGDTALSFALYNATRDPDTAVLDTTLDISGDEGEKTFVFEEDVEGVTIPTWSYTISWETQSIPIDTAIIGTDTTVHYQEIPPWPPSAGDKLWIRTKKLFTSEDSYTFTVEGSATKETVGEDELKEVRVVPNPYIVTAEWELNANRRKIAFTNLPPTCTIYIYTLTGDLVRKISRRSSTTGWEYWNLLNESNQMVAYGLYVYVVEIPGGTKTAGKFVVIR
ncbi:MAG: hypothetical protein ACE5HZ_01555 [Fidelibacterota bacterium]